MTKTHLSRGRASALRIALLWASSCLATPVMATSVLQFTFDELCDHSDVIIEGRVVAVESRVDAPRNQIATYVRIQVLDRLKGASVGSELELRFAGGTVGSLSLEIADMRLPAVGETGIYFVESLMERPVHPLVGWSQGHFIELDDKRAGRPGVFTTSGNAVVAIGRDISAGLQRQVVPGSGTALGVQVEDARLAPENALAVNDFKNQIRRSMASLRARQAPKP